MDAMPGILIAVFLGVFAALVAYTAAKSAWVRFRWRVLGYAPAIHDRDLVRETAEACAHETVRARTRASGTEPDGNERARQVSELAGTYRRVIETYAENFTLRL